MYDYKTFIGIATTGLLTLTASAASAAIIDFEIDFFDYDVLIGEGSFSYDDEEQLTCFEGSGFYDCFSESRLTELFGDLSVQEIIDKSLEEEIFVRRERKYYFSANIYNNSLTDFSANIYGINWGSGLNRWYADEETGQVPGERNFGRFGSFILDDWQFGVSAPVVESFRMDFTQASETSATGFWSQYFSPIIDPPPTLPVDSESNISNTSGTFEARRLGTTPSEPSDSTSVPEPSSVFGALIAMALGYRAKRRLAKADK